MVIKSRKHPHLYLGGSPRASLAIMNASKAFAAIAGRDFVIPEDIKRSVTPVMRHRVIVSPEREMEGMTAEQVIDMIVQSIEIPR
ncbi:MAG: MoxR-like ATPase [Dokdonia sp.]